MTGKKTPFSLEGDAALVTGSSQGIGLGIARGLEEAGAAVVYHGIGERSAAVPPGAPYVGRDLLEPDAPAALLDAASNPEEMAAAAQRLDAFLTNTVMANWPFPVSWAFNLEVWAPDSADEEPVLCWSGAGASVLPG